MTSASKWHDLRTRILTSAGIVAVGVAAMIAGGIWFLVLACLACAVMMWELARMFAPDRPGTALLMGGVTGACLAIALLLPPMPALVLLGAPSVAGIGYLIRHRLLFACFALFTMVAGYGLVTFRDSYGFIWLIWLVLIVVGTDVFGYFAGRMIGGPKFWPRVSPKKTWSGTVAGWIAALFIGAYFWSITTAGRDILWISVLMSFASQMGDIAESAVKRKMGVKDSSNLLPGHGGLFDRFDGLLGASLYMLIVAQFVVIPSVIG